MQRCQCFFYGSVFVPTMDLIEIDVVCAEPAQARVDFNHDRLAREPARVGSCAHRVEHLGSKHYFFAAGEVAQRASNNFFAGAVGISVGSVEEINAEFERSLEKGATLFFIKTPGMRAAFGYAVGHTSETYTRSLKTALPKLNVFHKRLKNP